MNKSVRRALFAAALSILYYAGAHIVGFELVVCIAIGALTVDVWSNDSNPS